MRTNYLIAIAGLQLLSKADDIRALGVKGAGKIEDGSVVSLNDDGETCSKVTTGNTDFGIVVFQHIGKSGRTDDNKAEAYIAGDVAPVMVMGRVWVKPSETITDVGKAAKVYVTAATGALSKTADGNIELVGAYWDTPTNSDGLAVVNLG